MPNATKIPSANGYIWNAEALRVDGDSLKLQTRYIERSARAFDLATAGDSKRDRLKQGFRSAIPCFSCSIVPSQDIRKNIYLSRFYD